MLRNELARGDAGALRGRARCACADVRFEGRPSTLGNPTGNAKLQDPDADAHKAKDHSKEFYEYMELEFLVVLVKLRYLHRQLHLDHAGPCMQVGHAGPCTGTAPIMAPISPHSWWSIEHD